jgi:hypothetical protein
VHIEVRNKLRDYGYGWVIGALFVASIVGHWIFGWLEYVNEQMNHMGAIFTYDYVVTMLSRTFENWQSEFLQLLCQVGLLTWLLFKGSPQSRDSEERMERKLDEIRRMLKDTKDLGEDLRQLRRDGRI